MACVGNRHENINVTFLGNITHSQLSSLPYSSEEDFTGHREENFLVKETHSSFLWTCRTKLRVLGGSPSPNLRGGTLL